MENNSQEALLEEAKRRYPIGTKFKPAHTPTTTDIYTVDSEPRFWTSGGDIIVGIKEKEDITPLLYYTKKWAIITEEKPKGLIGRWVKALVDSPVGGSVRAGEYGKFTSEYKIDFPSQKNYSCSIQTLTESLTKLELMPEGFEPSSEKGKPTDEFDFFDLDDDWEPSTETCKKCADRFYDGHVNSGPHNLCEGIHCQDMRESEEEEWRPKVGDWVMISSIYSLDELGEGSKFKNHGPYKVDIVNNDVIWQLSGISCCLHIVRFEPYTGYTSFKTKTLNKDLQSKSLIEEHFIVPLCPNEAFPILSKNKRKKLEVFIPNNKQESKPFQTIKLKSQNKN